MKSLNPFHYSLAELQKALIAGVGFLGLAAFFLFGKNFNPGLIPAIEVLVPAGFAVVAVFLATNHTPADLNKALIGFISAGVGVYRCFHAVNASDAETLVVMAGYVATFVGVYWAKGAAAKAPRGATGPR